MRILHITDRMGSRGGAEAWLRELLAGQAEREHGLHVAVGRGEAHAPSGVTATRVRGLAEGERRPVSDGLDALFEEVRPDVIHAHNALNPEALEWAADRGAVATVQDHRVFCPGRGKLTADGSACRSPMARETCRPCFREEARLDRMLGLTEARLAPLRRMRAVTVLSRYMARELAEVGVAEETLHVIPPFSGELDGAVGDDTLDGPPCVLFAGRLVRAKGVEDAVEVWRRAQLDLPLVFAGDGWMRPGLEEAGFEVLGWVPRERMAAVYRRARALLLPSRWQEPFGLVGLEALAHGVPVAAWDSGGVAEWLPEPPTPWGDLDALAARLWSIAGRAVTPPAGFDRRDALERFDALYRTLATKRRTRRGRPG